MVERLRAELRHAIAADGPGARDAEIALGDGPIRQRLKSSIVALAELRGRHGSICPSDAARTIGGENWRELMAQTRELARELAKSGTVQLTQRGTLLDPDDTWSGPIRIRIAGH